MTWDLPDRILFRICTLEVRNSSPFPLHIACLCATKLEWQIQHTQMFRDLPLMNSLDIELQTAPLRVQIKAMRDQLVMLKSLDDAPLFGPGLHQMHGDISASLDPSRGLALHQPAAAHPPPGAVHRHKLVIKEFRQSKGHIHIRAVVNEVVRNAQ